MTQRRSVLVTGGAGFIGSNLVRRLCAERATAVRVIDDLSSGDLDNLSDCDVDVIEGTILNVPLLHASMRDVDAVIHLAAIASVPLSVAEPRRIHEVNVSGTLNVLDEARQGGQHVIFASSSAVFGSNPKTPQEPRDWTRPTSPYGASKLAAESYMSAYATAYGLPTLVLRFFNVYGPGQRADHAYAAVIPRFIEAALTGAPVEIHGDGQQARDFFFVETLCDVLVDALNRRLTSDEPLHLAGGTTTTVLDIVRGLEQAFGRDLMHTHVPPRIGDVRLSQSTSRSLEQHFPTITPIDLHTGLARTIEWARAQRR